MPADGSGACFAVAAPDGGFRLPVQPRRRCEGQALALRRLGHLSISWRMIDRDPAALADAYQNARPFPHKLMPRGPGVRKLIDKVRKARG